MSFKDTGIGTIPEEWEIQTINEISKVIDSLHQTPTYSDRGISMVRVTDIKEGGLSLDNCFKVTDEVYELFTRNHKPSIGDIVISRVGTYGVFSYVKTSEKFCLGQNTAIISPKINSKYLYYNFINNRTKHQINNLAVGSTQKTISLKNIKAINIPVCRDNEQKAIADTLSCLDDKIELNNRINKTLEEMAQTIFKSWFVDFEPFQDGEFEDSELGRIPKGWRIEKIKNIADINKNTRKNGYIHKTIEYIDISAVSQGCLNSLNEYTIDQAPSRAQRLVSQGDTIWSCVRPNRRSYLYVQNPKENWVVSTGFTVLTPMKAPASYLYKWITTNEFVDYLTANADGSAYPAVRPSHFAEADIIIPPLNILERFDNVVNSLLLNIGFNETENSNLAKMRDALLPKLMSGEIRVPIQEVQ